MWRIFDSIPEGRDPRIPNRVVAFFRAHLPKRVDVEGKEKNESAHLSIVLFVRHSCPGPCNAAHCSNDVMPVSQGMRLSSWSSCDIKSQKFIPRMGRFSSSSLDDRSISSDLSRNVSDGLKRRDILFGRGGIERACIRAMANERSRNQKVITACIASQNSCVAASKRPRHDLWCSAGFEARAVERSPDSSRLFAAGLLVVGGVLLAGRIDCNTFAMPSQSSHGSHALPQIPLWNIISEKISDTSTSRHGLRRSSGGRTKGSTRLTKRRHHATSFSCCASEDPTSSGIGSKAVWGRSARYRDRCSC